MLAPFSAFAVALAASAVAVGGVRQFVLRKRILDVPNERSSHQTPAARGGGIGLLTGLVLSSSVMMQGAPNLSLLAASLGVVLVAWVGWCDDRGGASVRLRASVHVGAGLLLLPVALGALPAAPAWLLPLLAAWWVFWSISSINVVNFIDGIDGMIGLQAMVFGGHTWIAASSGGSDTYLAAGLGAALAGSALGFLLWNWHPARIFLGDVGSGALGLSFVLLGVLLIRERGLSLMVAYLPLAPIFLDASVTLFVRYRRGERLTEAHREHLYQRLANEAGLGHARVSATYGLASLAAIPVLAVGPWWGVGYAVLLPLAYAAAWRWVPKR
jgi:Fuc2NAc and GlcNAc transferase